MNWLPFVRKWKKTRRSSYHLYYLVNFSIQKKGSHTSICLLNEILDASIAPNLKSELVIIVENGESNILIDLTNCRYCDSSGMSVLLLGNRLCNRVNGKFILYGLSSRIKEIMDPIGLDQYLIIAVDKDEAEAFLL